MKDGKCKRINIWFLAFVLIAAIISGCGKSNNEPEESAKAVLDQVVSCSVKDAEEFDAVLTEMKESESKEEAGIESISGLEDYFKKRYGACMTDECLEQVMRMRVNNFSMALAKECSSDVKVEEMELKKRTGEEEIFDFDIKLTTADGVQAAEAAGNIMMVQDKDTWKASNLSMQFKKINN